MAGVERRMLDRIVLVDLSSVSQARRGGAPWIRTRSDRHQRWPLAGISARSVSPDLTKRVLALDLA
jgi:hypothetical protein